MLDKKKERRKRHFVDLSDRQYEFFVKVSEEKGITYTEAVRRVLDDYIDRSKGA